MSVISGIISSSKAPEPVGAYPHARRVGQLLFLSGVGPRKRAQRNSRRDVERRGPDRFL